MPDNRSPTRDPSTPISPWLMEVIDCLAAAETMGDISHEEALVIARRWAADPV